ncbi:MAG: hypothetical protein ACK4QL_08465 [Pseudanabaenaceae cyanobacterium]
MSKYLRVSKQLQLAEPAPSTAKFFESTIPKLFPIDRDPQRVGVNKTVSKR